jgi:hypothetical protein
MEKDVFNQNYKIPFSPGKRNRISHRANFCL